MRLHEIIGELCKFDPEDNVTLKSDQGSATDKVGYMIYELVTDKNLFSKDEHTNVVITKAI